MCECPCRHHHHDRARHTLQPVVYAAHPAPRMRSTRDRTERPRATSCTACARYTPASQPATASKLISSREDRAGTAHMMRVQPVLPCTSLRRRRRLLLLAARPPPMATISFPPPRCHFRPLVCTATPRPMEMECGGQGDLRLAPAQLRSAWLGKQRKTRKLRRNKGRLTNTPRRYDPRTGR
jgi:hypothetical protein